MNNSFIIYYRRFKRDIKKARMYLFEKKVHLIKIAFEFYPKYQKGFVSGFLLVSTIASNVGLAGTASSPFTVRCGPINDLLVESSAGGNIVSQIAGISFNIKST